jgi:hypothetical protein
VQMAIAADSLEEPLRGLTDLLTDLTQRSNFRDVFIYLCCIQNGETEKEADLMKGHLRTRRCAGISTTCFLRDGSSLPAVIPVSGAVPCRAQPQGGYRRAKSSSARSRPLAPAVVNTLFLYIICSRAPAGVESILGVQ